jgi:hypothetical protein
MVRDRLAWRTGRSCSIPNIGRFHHFGWRWSGTHPPRRLSTSRGQWACRTDLRSCRPSIVGHHRFGLRWSGVSLRRRLSRSQGQQVRSIDRSRLPRYLPSIALVRQRACSEPPSLRRSLQGTQPLALTSRGVHKTARCVSFVPSRPKVLRLTREANNNPVRGAVHRPFFAFVGWC